MNRSIVLVLTVLLSAVCLAQNSTEVQPAGAASQSASVSADKSGAQANSSSSAEITSQAAASGKQVNVQAASSNQLQAGSTVQAELSKPVDVRKNKPGDEVIAKTTQDVKSDGKVVLPKGSKIVGKVTQARARDKGQQVSQLGIAFDHAILKDGRQVPMAFAIQAISVSQAAAAASMADDSAAMEGNAGGMARASGSGGAGRSGATGGLAGGVASTAGGVVNTTGGAAGTTLHSAAGGELTSTSQGVGIPGLTLSPVASSTTTAGSVMSSSTSNVHLDSGTRMILKVTGQ